VLLPLQLEALNLNTLATAATTKMHDV